MTRRPATARIRSLDAQFMPVVSSRAATRVVVLPMPAGFVWNMSKRLLYYNDTSVRRIYVFDCDEAGLPVHDSRRVLREFTEDEGEPDVRSLTLMPPERSSITADLVDL